MRLVRILSNALEDRIVQWAEKYEVYISSPLHLTPVDNVH
jgi:hypothetical protein